MCALPIQRFSRLPLKRVAARCLLCHPRPGRPTQQLGVAALMGGPLVGRVRRQTRYGQGGHWRHRPAHHQPNAAVCGFGFRPLHFQRGAGPRDRGTARGCDRPAVAVSSRGLRFDPPCRPRRCWCAVLTCLTAACAVAEIPGGLPAAKAAAASQARRNLLRSARQGGWRWRCRHTSNHAAATVDRQTSNADTHSTRKPLLASVGAAAPSVINWP